MRDKLVDAARTLNAFSPWGEGWKAVRSTIYFDYTKHNDGNDVEQLPDNLAALEKELEPTELIPTIKTYVLSTNHDYWALDSVLITRIPINMPQPEKDWKPRHFYWDRTLHYQIM